MACSEINNQQNENYFVALGDEKYIINNKVFGDNNKLLKIDVDKIILAAEYYTTKPIVEHCYQFGLEKWHDWFTIPYYYLTNNIESQELKEIHRGTWSQGNCYDKCDNKKVVAISGDKTKCISINIFKGGKYKSLLEYDPIALISLLGSYNIYKSNIPTYSQDSIHYSYEDIINKYKNNGQVYDKRKYNIKDVIDITGPSLTELTVYQEILKKDIESAILRVLEYIRELIDKSYTEENIEKNDERDKIIYESIENDLNKFYYLFDDKDEYYLNYLTNKINNENDLVLGKYCGAQYAYNIAIKKNENDAIDENFLDELDLSSFGISSEDMLNIYKNKYIKYLKHIFKYSKELCFTNNYLFKDRLNNYGIITEESNVVENSPTNLHDKIFNSNNNIKIEKEIRGTFSNYEYVLKYYNSLPTIAYVLVLISAFIMFIYYVFYAYNGLHKIALLINAAVMLMIWLPTLFLYVVILLILFIANIVVFLPLSIVMKLYSALRPYFTVLLILILFVMLTMTFTINGRKIILDMIKLAWKLFTIIIYLFIDIIIWILKQPIIVSLIIIYFLYLTYAIISNDLEMLIERHLDFYIKRILIELRISQFLLRYIKRGNDSFQNMLYKYKINYNDK
jgi:hypothetical protein